MAASASVEPSATGVYYLELIGATHVPKADTLSESDPYAEVWLESPVGRQVSNTATSATIADEKHPFWYAPLVLTLTAGCEVDPAALSLHLSLFDRDPDKSDFLGAVDLPIEELPADSPRPLRPTIHPKYAKASAPPCVVTLCRRTGLAGLAVEVVRASNCPRADIQSESDPYCLLQVTDAAGRPKGRPFRTAAKLDSPHPTWREHAFFYVHPAPGDLLALRVVDLNLGTSDTGLASLAIPLETLADPAGFHKSLTLELAPRRKELQAKIEPGKPFSVELRPLPLRFSAARITRRVFFVRHGESMWNEATEQRELGKMLANDHPLSEVGIRQARRLRELWQASAASSEPRFLEAAHMFCSPLTRALQTCMIAMHGHPLFAQDAAAPSLHLLATAREVKTVVGLDTIGVACGQSAILSRVHQATAPFLPLDQLVPAAQVDAFQAADKWWCEGKENKADMEHRWRSFLNTLVFFPSGLLIPPSASLIVVGHSLFLRDFCRKYLAPFRQDLAAFGLQKLSNAGCVALDLEWNPSLHQSDSPAIYDIRLLFGSTLLDE